METMLYFERSLLQDYRPGYKPYFMTDFKPELKLDFMPDFKPVFKSNC